jgi:hypothetical protein
MYVEGVPNTVAEVSFSTDKTKMTFKGVIYGHCVSALTPPPTSTELSDDDYYTLFENFDRIILRHACSIQQKEVPVVLTHWLDSISTVFMEASTYAKVRNLVLFAYEFLASRGKSKTIGISEFDKEMANLDMMQSIDGMLRTHMRVFAHGVTDDGIIITPRIQNLAIMTDDILCALKGSSYPFVLRLKEGCYEFITSVTTDLEELTTGLTERFFFSSILQSFTII